MDKIEVVKVAHVEFRKDCAKGRTFKQFETDHKHPNFNGVDLAEAYVKLGGKGKVPKKDTEE